MPGWRGTLPTRTGQGSAHAYDGDREDRELEDSEREAEALEATWTYWRLCDELTVNQAAHLLIGMSPTEVESATLRGAELTPRSERQYRNNLSAATTAIGGALRKGVIRGRLVPESLHDINGNPSPSGEIEHSTDNDASVVEVESLKNWLSARGFRRGFFFPLATDAPDYLDPQHPRYAPKLAAAVSAWLAVDDPKGKHPKGALMKWLREHGPNFGLSDEEGKPNELGIEECAKVANWQPGGGAPKTPSG